MITIQHIKTAAFNYFIAGETVLKVEPFLKKLQQTNDLSQFTEAQKVNLVCQALDSLNNICTSVGSDCYILTKPVDTYTQTIEISGDLAVLISNIINSAVRRLRNDESLILTDPLSIKEEDIHSLALMAQQTLETYNPNNVPLNEEETDESFVEDQEDDEDEGDDDLIPPFLKG